MLSAHEIDDFLAKDDIKRVDPDGCGCTDCIVGGYSRPFNQLSDKQLVNFVRGTYQDATGYDRSVIIDEVRERGLVADDSDDDSGYGR